MLDSGRRHLRSAAIAALLIMSFSAPAFPQAENPGVRPGAPELGKAAPDDSVPQPATDRINDSEFLARAAALNAFTITAAQIGAERAARPAVSAPDLGVFARKLVADHEARAKAAAALGTGAPPAGQGGADLAPDQTALIQELRTVPDAGFADFFLGTIMKSSADGTNLMRAYFRNGQTTALREYARQSLPVIEEHLGIAVKLRRDVRADAIQGRNRAR
jgi:predicted outer membrane protein